MMILPSLDFHAHINPNINSDELRILPSVIFAMTRNTEEAESVLERTDDNTIWGVGCHPGLVGVQKGFSIEKFSHLIDKTPVVGEIGLDGKSRVPLSFQRENLTNIFKVLSVKPRITSLHNYDATEEILLELESTPIKGAILHWWLGTAEQTKKAVSLGCYFSINASSVSKTQILNLIPVDRILTETDHPYGDRFSTKPQRPGQVDDVELKLGNHFGKTHAEMRLQIWKNFGNVVRETDTYKFLPRKIRTKLAANL